MARPEHSGHRRSGGPWMSIPSVLGPSRATQRRRSDPALSRKTSEWGTPGRRIGHGRPDLDTISPPRVLRRNRGGGIGPHPGGTEAPQPLPSGSGALKPPGTPLTLPKSRLSGRKQVAPLF